MKAVLVFIDGTICDRSLPLHLLGKPEFYQSTVILNSLTVPGSVECLQDLARQYQITYIGARPVRSAQYQAGVNIRVWAFLKITPNLYNSMGVKII